MSDDMSDGAPWDYEAEKRHNREVLIEAMHDEKVREFRAQIDEWDQPPPEPTRRRPTIPHALAALALWPWRRIVAPGSPLRRFGDWVLGPQMDDVVCRFSNQLGDSDD